MLWQIVDNFKTNVILKCYWNINKSQKVLIQASQVALVVKSLLSNARDIRDVGYISVYNSSLCYTPETNMFLINYTSL